MHLYGYASLWHKLLVPLASLTHLWVSPSPVALALLGALHRRNDQIYR